MFTINVVIAALIAVFLATQFSAAAAIAANAAAANSDFESANAAAAGSDFEAANAAAAAQPAMVGQPEERARGPGDAANTEQQASRRPEESALGRGDAPPDADAAASQVRNALIDGYTASGFTGGAEPLAPIGWILPAPVAAALKLPDGTYANAAFWQTADFSLTRVWFAARTSFSFPLSSAAGFGIVTLTHDTLFWHLWIGLSILLAIEAIMFINRSLKIRRAVRRMLRPITELTIAAQSELTLTTKSGMPPTPKSIVAAGALASPSVMAPAVGPTAPAGMDMPPSAAELKLSDAIDTINAITERDLDRRISIHDEREELQGLAEAINGMLNRLDSAYRAQLRFVSDASHELRTPISVIQGYANLLDRWGKNDEKTLQESIDAIKHEAEGMQSLVEQLLFLARGENRTIAPELAATDISQLVEDAVREARMIDEAHAYASSVEPGLSINCDAGLIKQALRILVDNSMKYTPNGGSITVKAARSAPRPGYVEIAVQDSGMGIPSEALPHIFDRFYRADESRTRNTGGTGLGLAIAKWIVDSHDGFVDVISRNNAGTRITMSFPAN